MPAQKQNKENNEKSRKVDRSTKEGKKEEKKMERKNALKDAENTSPAQVVCSASSDQADLWLSWAPPAFLPVANPGTMIGDDGPY